jgi:hypothetical protein
VPNPLDSENLQPQAGHKIAIATETITYTAKVAWGNKKRNALSHLGDLYREQNKHQEAEEYYVHATFGKKEALHTRQMKK